MPWFVCILLAAAGCVGGASTAEAAQDSDDTQHVASTATADSSLVPLGAEVLLLDDAFLQCTWLHPAVMPVGGPEQLALAPPPLTLQTGPAPEAGDTGQTEAAPSPPQPPPRVNKTMFIVHDGGIKETERTNVAAAQDGARLLFANPEAKKPEAILNGDSFSFMKNSCGDVKFVVIELSQRVKLTSLEISMVELYSSRARTIDLYSTLTKPTKAVESPWLVGDWAYHATVRVENKKGDHVFNFLPQQFTRYLLLHFTAHYGSESVCTINNVRVFGVTETEDLEAQLEALQDTAADAAAAAAAFAAAAADMANPIDPGDADVGHEATHGDEDSAALPPSVEVDSESHVHVDGGDHPAHPAEAEAAAEMPGAAGSARDGNDVGDALLSQADAGALDSGDADTVLVPGTADSSAPVPQEPAQSDADAKGGSAALPEEHLDVPDVATGVPEAEAPALQSEGGSLPRKFGHQEPVEGVSGDSTLSGGQPGPPGDGATHRVGGGTAELAPQQNSKQAPEANQEPSGEDGEGGSDIAPGTPAVHSSSHAGSRTPEENSPQTAHSEHAPQPGEDSAQPHSPTVKENSVPQAQPTASKGGVAKGDSQSLLLGDGTVTGMYQMDMPNGDDTKSATPEQAIAALPDAATGSAEAAADVAAAAAAAGAPETEGGDSTSSDDSSTTAPSKSNTNPPASADAARSGGSPADVPAGGRSQQQRGSEGTESAAPASAGTGAAGTASPHSPPASQPAYASQSRAQAQPAGGSASPAADSTASASTSTAGSASVPAVSGEGAPTATSKTGSVYDTIKKELLSLRVETSTLSKSLASTATIANVTALTRRHDATAKRVSAVSTRVHELEELLAGLQLAGAEAARAQQRLQTEVSAAIVLSVAAIALGIFSYLSYRTIADVHATHASVNRSYHPAQARSNSGPVFFYPRSQSYADLSHPPSGVPQSRSAQSLPNAAMQQSQMTTKGAPTPYGNPGSAPSSHSHIHHTALAYRSPSETVGMPHMGPLSPPPPRGAASDLHIVLGRIYQQSDDRAQGSEHHDPLDSFDASPPHRGRSPGFRKQHSGGIDVHGAHAHGSGAWNSESAFNEPAHAPVMLPPMRRSFGTNSIHSIRSQDGLHRRQRSRASSGLPSPVATSPTAHVHRNRSTGTSSGAANSGSSSSAGHARRSIRGLARSSAPTRPQADPSHVPAHSASGSAASTSGIASGTNTASVSPVTTTTDTAGRLPSHLDATNCAGSTDTEDLLPAPTFAPLAQQPRIHGDASSCTEPERGAAARSSSQPLPLSDSRAHCADIEHPNMPPLSPQGALGAAALVLDHGQVPWRGGSRAGSCHTSSKLDTFDSERRSHGNHPPQYSPPSSHSHEATEEQVPPSHGTVSAEADCPSVSEGSLQYGAPAYTASQPPATLGGHTDGSMRVSASTCSSVSPLYRASLTRHRSRPSQLFGSMNGPRSEGSALSDAWGGSDSGSNRGHRGRSVHVLNSHPSAGSLPGGEAG